MNSIKIIKKRDNYDLYLTFFSKKVEKIVSALYLLTDYFPEEESLKWQLRRKGIQLLSDTMSLSKNNGAYKDRILSDIKRIILEIISYLEISLEAKIITEMNAEMFKNELNFLLKLIEDNYSEFRKKESPILKRNFFKVKERDLRLKTLNITQENVYKGQVKGHTKMSFNPSFNKAKEQDISNIEKKQLRKKEMLKLFGKGQKLTIKDISQTINDCGEKTIQRELQSMMKEGIIKKEGERRWSRYFLKSDL